MDQESDSGHDQGHDPAQRIHGKAQIDLQVTKTDPGGHGVADESFGGRHPRQAQENGHRKGETDTHGSTSHQTGDLFWQTAIQKTTDGRTDQGHQDDPPQQ